MSCNNAAYQSVIFDYYNRCYLYIVGRILVTSVGIIYKLSDLSEFRIYVSFVDCLTCHI